uniref:Cell surface protein n=1 Tax=Spumella elongata TaxID=89044 RepID=A0A7S3H407_9STRA|mmetsp:Transcript_34144/g.58670  ORF Transcript_34144/g.58670 Transcript_34144/m.58670 type:complete len:603 (+) Transcript_34144:56-1864(+)|eukprot:CAMPEP_0185004208 /NCGR_PEP_ID=MMETSP1098-20130426/78611_1 /TAXON_ID=89044 /ORGANISM="Spumella elongata, Strain CCAP 955/1" /LENGTH=602 /DNA_ID=CAMNT_0027531999 /DNA_START=42 /DNA_END=1850 /DNA_ORIENTATION=+
MKKNVLALSIAAMIGGLGFVGTASAALDAAGNSNALVGTGVAGTAVDLAAGQLTKATATALTTQPGGVGHALLVPYFNAQNGNMTVLHVTNTDQTNGKAVKVRFRGAANSDDILDFQVFLSPGDVWTAAVTAGADGVANIVTGDNTCTVPALTNGVGQPFVMDRLNPNLSTADKAAQTREGYVEIFNMADIAGDKVWKADGTLGGTVNSPLFTATKHASGVAPCSVAGSAARTALNAAALTNFTETSAATAGLNTPTGGLMGDWYIINVPQTTTFAGGATALQATGGNLRANFVHFPQNNAAATFATVASNPNFVTADPLFRSDAINAVGVAFGTTPALNLLNFDLPDLSTPYVTSGAAPAATSAAAQAASLTGQLAVTSITNQYANDASITAKTDWVFSMPSRRYNVAANYKAITGTTPATSANSLNAAYRLFTNFGAAGVAEDFFYSGNGADFAVVAPANVLGNTTVDAKGNICVNADGQKFFDREETTASSGAVFSPGSGAPAVQFCGEVSVLAFADTGNSVLSSSVARSTITSGTYVNGWGVVSTGNRTTADLVGPPVVSGLKGLPILGSAFIKLTNPNTGAGVSGTYGITWDHRFTK